MKARAHFSNSAGSALLMALWALLLLSAVVFAWVKFINANIAIAAEANFGLQARALAHSGVQVAMNPLVSPATPALEQTLGNGSYRVTLTGEGGKLNLNWLLSREDLKRIDVLKKYLNLRGLDFQQIETLADSLRDRVDKDGKRGKLLTLDEIKQLKGSGALTSLPGWSDDFTLWSVGPIDLQYASPLVLESLPIFNDALAKVFLAVRAGPDKKEGTQDDKIFKDMGEVAITIGFTQKQLTQQIGTLVTLKDPNWRAVSIGQAANRTRQVEVVFRKGGAQPQIFLWKEF